MDLNLTGKAALITGASKGIGAAIARTLAGEGCDLYLAARSADKLAALREELHGRHNVAVTEIAMDLAAPGAMVELAARCDGVDILINNAGAIPGGRIDAIDEAKWRAVWDLKVFGYINLTREIYARMKAAGGGVIVNIIGVGGESPRSNYICGATGNAALMSFSRALGGDSMEDGIRVVAINPGPVETERLVEMMQDAARERHGDETRWRELLAPLSEGRAATVEEIADMAAFVASERSAYTSGTVITLDGGYCYRGSLF